MLEQERECSFNLMNYFDEMRKSMNYLAKNKKTIFIGQAVAVPGTTMSRTLTEIDSKKLIELPVAEEMQMGITTGLALNGDIPISIYPRWNFLLLAMNQLINHLDKIPLLTKNKFQPKIIIRVIVGANKPLNAGLQHTQDYSSFLKNSLHTVNLYKLNSASDIKKYYNQALKSKFSSILVEYTEKY